MVNFTDQEILNFIDGKNSFDFKQIQARTDKQFFAFRHSDNQRLDLIYNKKLVQNIQKAYTKEEKVSSFCGIAAFKGSVKGRVKLILNKDDFGKFKKGDILVAHVTSPAYVTIVKLAKAIITSEGGITCHAAVVSRELKIPCVVGTKVAAQVLRDGDQVEVDAKRGIIKIMK